MSTQFLRELDALGVSRSDELCNNHAATDKCAKDCAAYESVTSFCYVHSNGGSEEQNILNLELALF